MTRTHSAGERAGIYIGPARVATVQADGRPVVQILGGSCETVAADWAIPFRYEPDKGDLLLVLGKHGRYWITGIVHGSGASQMAFHGNVELASSGTLQVAASGGVYVDSPEVHILTEAFDVDASQIVQRFEDMDSEVTERIEERAGTCERVIDGEDEQIAARHETVARRAVKVDGELLRLS